MPSRAWSPAEPGGGRSTAEVVEHSAQVNSAVGHAQVRPSQWAHTPGRAVNYLDVFAVRCADDTHHVGSAYSDFFPAALVSDMSDRLPRPSERCLRHNGSVHRLSVGEATCWIACDRSFDK